MRTEFFVALVESTGRVVFIIMDDECSAHF